MFFFVLIIYKKLVLLQTVFANEMTTWRDVYYDFTTFKILVCIPSQPNDNNHDSGIYVIRQMQCRRQNCFDWVSTKYLIELLLLVEPRFDVWSYRI